MSNSKALEIHLKVREPEHPVVALSFNNLGNVYYKHGKLEEALQYYRQTLGIMRKAFGDLHPHVAVTNRCISLVLKESCNASEASAMFAETVTVHRAMLGPKHHLTVQVEQLCCRVGSVPKA